MFSKGGISIKESSDYDYFDSVVAEPSIASAVSEDWQKGIEFKTKDLPEGTRFIEVSKDGSRCGFFCFQPSQEGYEQHTVLTENCRGVSAITAGKLAIDLLRSITGCKVLTSFVFANEPHTKWYASKLGFSECGVLCKSFHAGEETDVIFLRKQLEE